MHNNHPTDTPGLPDQDAASSADKRPGTRVTDIIQYSMDVLGMKKTMEKNIINNTFNKEAATIPASINRKLNLKTEDITGRKVWTLSPKGIPTTTVVLFLHGGAYYANITRMHWRFIEQLVSSTQASFIVPDYPLAPESSCLITYQFLENVYKQLIAGYSTATIVFMGDSAGGGLALGFAQKLRSENIQQPKRIILFSPWLDVSMTNPDIPLYDPRDKILSVNGLKIAGAQYAGELALNDYRVSPIHGTFTQLGRISLFIGTNDILLADARKLKQLLEQQELDFDYYEYPGLFHDWVIISHLKETREVIQKINEIMIND